MAQFWEDWSGSTLNAEPTGWTKQFVTSGTLYRVEEDASGHAPAGRRLLIDKSATDRAGLSFDAVGAAESDVQVRVLVRSLATHTSSTQFGGPSARMGGSSASETVIYGALATSGATEKIRNIEISSGTVSALDYGAANNSWVVDSYYWLTLTVSGGSATVAIAAVATPETPIDSVASSVAVSSAGNVGLFSSYTGTVLHVLAVGVGTDGDPAPYSAPAADTTAPTLTSPTASATGATTASGSVTTNEADGTLYYLASANATELAATVKAGSSQAVTQSATPQSVSFTGLTAATPYYPHYLHRDAAGNDSAVASGAQFTTSAAGDTTPPTLTGSVTFASITQTSYTAQWPAGSDNVAVTGYEYQIGSTAGAWTDVGNNLSAAITGRTAGATETVYVRNYDAAGLRSTPAISGEVTLLAATASVTSDEFKNNTGTLLASATIPKVWLIPFGTPDYTNLVTNGAGELVISEAGLSGDYLILTANADGTEVGVSKATAS